MERQLNVSCLSFSGKRFYSFPRLSREVGVRVLNWTERGAVGGNKHRKKSCCSSEKQARRRENQVFKRDIQDEK